MSIKTYEVHWSADNSRGTKYSSSKIQMDEDKVKRCYTQKMKQELFGHLLSDSGCSNFHVLRVNEAR